MSGKKYSSDLLELLQTALDGYVCHRRNMFGCPVFFADGNLFCGVDEDTIFIRLAETDRESLLSEYDEARHFDPMGGHPMREYVVVPELFHGRMDLLTEYLYRSYEYARQLPVKKSSQKL